MTQFILQLFLAYCLNKTLPPFFVDTLGNIFIFSTFPALFAPQPQIAGYLGCFCLSYGLLKLLSLLTNETVAPREEDSNRDRLIKKIHNLFKLADAPYEIVVCCKPNTENDYTVTENDYTVTEAAITRLTSTLKSRRDENIARLRVLSSRKAFGKTRKLQEGGHPSLEELLPIPKTTIFICERGENLLKEATMIFKLAFSINKENNEFGEKTSRFRIETKEMRRQATISV